MNLPEAEVMTLAEVAAYLRIHASTVYRLLKHDQIPAFRVGSDWRFRREVIDQWRHERETARKVPDSARKRRATG